MFNKLRNHLILINLGITSVLILAVFSGIYFFATNSAENRLPAFSEVISEPNNYYAEDFLVVLKTEKAMAAQQLLTLLIVAGVAIELMVALVSYYLAGEAIKPVREAYEAQKLFIANASHEIKTPLAAIAANLEAAGVEDNRFIDNAVRETEKLANLNAELLRLVRAEMTSETTTSEVELAERVRQLTKSFEPRLGKREVEFEILADEKVGINARDFEKIFEILMDNAVKYAEARIVVTVAKKRVVVASDGKPLKKSELERIFDRFYQVNKSAEGVGLGLAIAKTLAEKNGWKLFAEVKNNLNNFVLEL